MLVFKLESLEFLFLVGGLDFDLLLVVGLELDVQLNFDGIGLLQVIRFLFRVEIRLLLLF